MIGKNIIENLISDVMKFSWVQINGNSLKVERIWKLKEESGCRKSFLRVLLMKLGELACGGLALDS